MTSPMSKAITTVCAAEDDAAEVAAEAGEGAVTPDRRRRAARAPAPTRPTRLASSSTEVSTWRRPAPTARSRASSRVRCWTMIEKVLVITKIAHQQGDAGEDLDDDREEREPLLHVGGQPVGRLLTGEHLDVVGEHLADGGRQLLLADAGLGAGEHLVHLAGDAGQPLGLGEGEQGGHGAAGALGGAEPDGADEGVVLVAVDW